MREMLKTIIGGLLLLAMLGLLYFLLSVPPAPPAINDRAPALERLEVI